MKNLIRKILREQEEEDFSPVIPKFKKGSYREGRIFDYLDNLLGNLKKRKPKHYNGFVFTKDEIIDLGVSPPIKGIIGYDKTNKDLYITYPLILKLIYKFNLSGEDRAKLIFKEWFEDKFQLEVSDATIFHSEIPIDDNDRIFEYLDSKFLNTLERHRKPKYYKGTIFEDPNTEVFPNRNDSYDNYDKEYGILGWEEDETLFIYMKIVDDVTSRFNLTNVLESMSIIGKWFSDRTGLKVQFEISVSVNNRSYLAIDEEILREQEEEDFSPIIPKFNYAKKYKDVYAYFDKITEQGFDGDGKGLYKVMPKFLVGVLFVLPEYKNKRGILAWGVDRTLYIMDSFLDSLYLYTSDYGLKEFSKSEIMLILGKWFTDRYELEVKNTKEVNYNNEKLMMKYPLGG